MRKLKISAKRTLAISVMAVVLALCCTACAGQTPQISESKPSVSEAKDKPNNESSNNESLNNNDTSKTTSEDNSVDSKKENMMYKFEDGNQEAVAIDKNREDAPVYYSRSTLLKKADEPRAAFSLDYTLKNPDNETYLSYEGNISSTKVVSVLLNGYGGISPSVYGLSNSTSDSKKFYLATQMAIWQTISGTSDTKGKTFNINDISPNNSANEDLVNTAKKIANQILAKSYNLNFSFSLNSTNAKVDYDYSNIQLRSGPYTVDYSGYAVGAYDVSLGKNAPKSAKVVDKNGTERTKFEMKEEFYVVVDKADIKAKETISVNATVEAMKYVGYIYTAGEGYQNYGYLDFETEKLTSKKEFNVEEIQQS